MWGRIGNLASVITGSEEEAANTSSSGMEAGSAVGSEAELTDIHIQIMEQDKMILQLKEMIRDREKVLSEKDGELKKVTAEMSKVKLQFKSKVASLTKQLTLQHKSSSDAVERASVGSDESVSTLASESTATGDHTSRARQTLLRKQLKDRDKLLTEKEAQLAQLYGQLEVKERVIAERDVVVNETKSRLAECELQITTQSATLDQLRESFKEVSGNVSEQDLTTKSQLQVRMDEMLAQMVYKDSRTMELDSEIQQLNQTVIDLRENVAEKDEVIRGRDQAIQIIQAALAERTADRDKLQSELASRSHVGDAGNRLERDGAFQEVIDSLQQRLLQLSEELTAREKAMEQVSTESLRKDQSIAEMSSQFNDLQQKFALSEQNYFAISQTYTELYQNFGLLSHGHRKLEDEYGILQHERQGFDERHASLEMHCKTLQQKVDELQLGYVAIEGSNVELKQNHESMERKYTSLEQSHVELEQSYIQLQMSHIELEQNYTAADASRADVEAALKECLQQKEKLERKCSELEQSVVAIRMQLGASAADEHSFSNSQLIERDSVIEQLRKDAEASEARFSKFKALAGSKIKALEKELEELKQHSAEVIELRNKLAELEEEKGNLQLQLLDSEEVKPGLLDKTSKQTDLEELIGVLRNENVELANRNSLLEVLLREKADQVVEQLNLKLDFEKQLLALSVELDSKREQVSVLGIELQNKEESLQQSQDNLHSSEVRLAELFTEMQTVNDALNQLKKDAKDKDLFIANITLELKDTVAASNYLKSELAEKSESFASNLKVKEDAMLSEISHQNELLAELQREIESKSENIDNLQLQIVQQEQLIVLANDDLGRKNAKISDHEKDIELKMMEIESLRLELESDLSSQVAIKDEALDTLKLEVMSKCKQVESLEQDIANNNALIESIKEELRRKNEEISDLTAANEHQVEEFSSIQQVALSRMHSELEHMQSEDIKNVSTISSLEEDVARLSQLLAASSGECDAVKSNINVLLEREDHYKSVIQRLEQQLAESELSIKLKEQEKLDAVSSLNEQIHGQSDQLHIQIAELEKLKVSTLTSTAASESIQDEIRDKNDKITLLLQQLHEQDMEINKRSVEYSAAMNSWSQEIEKLTAELSEKKSHLVQLEFDFVERQRKLEEIESQLKNVQTGLEQSDETLKQERCNFLTREAELSREIDIVKLELQRSVENEALLHRRCEEDRQAIESLEKKCASSETKIASLSENLQEEETQLIAVTLELDKWKAEAEQLKLQHDVETHNILVGKEEEISKLNDSLHERETQMKKYIAIIKKMKLQLQEEKAKVQEVEKSFELKADTSISEVTTDSPRSPAECEDHRLLLEELQRKVVELSEELGRKELEISSLVESRDRLCKELSTAAQDANSRCESVQVELADVVKRHEQEKNVLNTTLHTQSNELYKNSELLQGENHRLQEKLSECENSKLDLEAQIDKLLQQNQTLKQDAEKFASIVLGADSLGIELQEVSREMNLWKQLAEEAQSATRDLSGRFEMDSRVLMDENSSLKTVIENLSVEVQMLNNSLGTHQVNMDHLKTQLAELVSEKDLISKTQEQCNYEKNVLETELEKTFSEKLQLDEELRQAKEVMNSLLHEAEQLRRTIREQTEAMEKLKLDSWNFENERLKVVQVEEEYKLREVSVETLQLQLENVQKSSFETASRHTEMYSQLEKQYADLDSNFNETKHRLEMEKDALVSKLKCFESSDDNVKIQNEGLVHENVNLIAQLTKAETEIAVLEEHLKLLTIQQENSVVTFKQTREGLETEKLKLEVEMGKAFERAVKAEGSVQLLRAELEADRERFSEREAELEGSSEELQLEVARLSQDLESIEDRCHNVLQENEQLKFEIHRFGSEKENLVLTMKAEGLKREKELLNEIDRLNGDIEKLQLEKERLNDERTVGLETMDKRYVELSRQYDMLNSDISTYQDLVHDLKLKNTQLEQQLKQTSASHDGLVSSLELANAELQNVLHDKQMYEDNVHMWQDREAATSRELEELKWKLDEFISTEEELEETQNVLFTMKAENVELKIRIDNLEKRNADLTLIEAEATALQDKYMAVLQDNNALIRQSKDMYEKLRSSGGMTTEQLQTSSTSTSSGETDALSKEIVSLKAELLSNKAVHQSKLQLMIDENSQLHQEVTSCKAELEALRGESTKLKKPEESELLRSELKQLQSRYEQCRAKLAAAQSKVRMDQSQPQVPGRQTVKSPHADVIDIDDCPKVHASLLHSAYPASGEQCAEDKELECTRLRSQVTQMVAEKDNLASRVNAAEQTVKQRESEMVHIHQQYQLLYQQFAALQIHYAALEQRLQAASPTNQVVSKIQEGSTNIPEESTAVPMLTQRMQLLQRQIDDSTNETNELRKQLLAESQARAQSDEMLNEAREQLQIHQQLSARSADQRAINMEDSDDRDSDRSKVASVLANPRDVQQLYRVIRQWWQSSSILLGRTLRGQPRIRKSFLAYIFLLHIYVLFACILTGA